MLNIIKNSFKLTNKYIILATPLILFSLISSLYVLFSSKGSAIGVLFSLLLFFLMLGAFISGWFYMVRKCIENDDYDISALLAEFPAGVGEYFLPSCGLIIITLVVSAAIMTAAYFIGLHTIGDIKEVFEALINASTSSEDLKAFIIGLPMEKLIKLNLWNLLALSAALVTYFMLMFYSPALFFKKKNPFSALIIAIKDLFSRKFFKNLLLFVIVFGIYFVLSIFSAIGTTNVFTHFVFTLVNFYYLVFAIVYIYNYYYKTFVQVGANIDTRV